MKMPNKHYLVEYCGKTFSYFEKFTSIVKAKSYYKKILLNNNEFKKLYQDKCVLIEDSYFNNIWEHKEKGFKTNV